MHSWHKLLDIEVQGPSLLSLLSTTHSTPPGTALLQWTGLKRNEPAASSSLPVLFLLPTTEGTFKSTWHDTLTSAEVAINYAAHILSLGEFQQLKSLCLLTYLCLLLWYAGNFGLCIVFSKATHHIMVLPQVQADTALITKHTFSGTGWKQVHIKRCILTQWHTLWLSGHHLSNHFANLHVSVAWRAEDWWL